MRYQTKQIRKEDGRTLIYYHFPETASDSQRAAFEAIDSSSIKRHNDAGEHDQDAPARATPNV